MDHIHAMLYHWNYRASGPNLSRTTLDTREFSPSPSITDLTYGNGHIPCLSGWFRIFFFTFLFYFMQHFNTDNIRKLRQIHNSSDTHGTLFWRSPNPLYHLALWMQRLNGFNWKMYPSLMATFWHIYLTCTLFIHTLGKYTRTIPYYYTYVLRTYGNECDDHSSAADASTCISWNISFASVYSLLINFEALASPSLNPCISLYNGRRIRAPNYLEIMDTMYRRTTRWYIILFYFPALTSRT